MTNNGILISNNQNAKEYENRRNIENGQLSTLCEL